MTPVKLYVVRLRNGEVTEADWSPALTMVSICFLSLKLW